MEIELEMIRLTKAQFEELIFACENGRYKVLYFLDKLTGGLGLIRG